MCAKGELKCRDVTGTRQVFVASLKQNIADLKNATGFMVAAVRIRQHRRWLSRAGVSGVFIAVSLVSLSTDLSVYDPFFYSKTKQKLPWHSIHFFASSATRPRNGQTST